jgi:RecA-family ATPase
VNTSTLDYEDLDEAERRSCGKGFDVPDQPPLTIAEWRARDLAQPDYLMGDWMTTTSRILQVAPTGIGKTNFAMQLGMAVAGGRNFLHWRGCRASNVLYVDGEMSRRLLRQRIIDAADRLGEDPTGFHALSHEGFHDFCPLTTKDGQEQIEYEIARIGRVGLVIFDSVMCLINGNMKDEVPWNQAMPWIRSLTHSRIGQLWVNHTGHDETRQYGTKNPRMADGYGVVFGCG